MKCRQWGRVGLWWLFLAVGVGVLGCSEPSVFEPEEPTLPLSNERIISETTLGTPTMTNAISAMYEARSSLVYVRGTIDDSDVIGSATRQGQVQWQAVAEPWARCLCPVPPNDMALVDGVISVGAIEPVADGDEQAVVQLRGAGGTQIAELVIDKPGSDVWLNSVDVVQSLVFVAAGGFESAGQTYPYVVTFEIGADSLLVMGSDFTFVGVHGQYVREVAVDPLRVTDDGFVCYAMARQYENALGAESVPIHAFRVSTMGTHAYDLEWTAEITPPNALDMSGSTDCLTVRDGTIYFAGTAEVEKEKGPSNGGYWDAGFVGSLSQDGTPNWLKVISISPWSERYYGLYATGNVLYAVGRYGAYQKSKSNEQFGLAFLSIFDLNTGNEKYHLGLGSEEYASTFNSIIVEGSRAYCSGWTNSFVLDEGREAWFAEVSLDGLVQASRAELPDVPRAWNVSELQDAPRVRAHYERIDRQ